MKVEDALNIMKKSLVDAKKATKDPRLHVVKRIEAKSVVKAYAHCISLLSEILTKKGWS
jgi:hypothetical protein